MFFSVILGFAVKSMITRDKPGLSRKTRFYDERHGISIAKPGFSIEIPGFRIIALKSAPFYSKTWFCGEKPGLTEQNLVLQSFAIAKPGNCKTWFCSVKPGFAT